MSDFGGKLRLARERRGISLRQIAANTKISVAALEALERNDVSKLPGGIFSRSFVRAYAVEVGLDPDETVREFLERFQGTPTAVQLAPHSIPDEEIGFEHQQRIAGVVLKLVLIAVPLVVLILYFAMRTRSQSQVSVTPAAGEPATAIAAQGGALGVPPAAEAIIPPRPSATDAGASTARGAPAAGVMKLELHPTGDCWIRLTVDGKQVLSRLMVAGETDVRDVRNSATIDVGNAGTFAFSVDGRPGKPLGQDGQVRTATITRETLSRYLQ